VSALYQRLAARRGKKRALMAVAHSIVVSAFSMLSRNESSHEAPPTLTNVAGTISSTGLRNGLSGWGIV
jgi:hypothetical protein